MVNLAEPRSSKALARSISVSLAASILMIPALAAASEIIHREQDGIGLRYRNPVETGQLLVADIQTSCPAPRVLWQESDYGVYGVGGYVRALLPVSLEIRTGSHPLVVRCQSKEVPFEVIVVEGRFSESRLRVDPKFSSPPPARVTQENATIAAGFDRGRPWRIWKHPFVVPTRTALTSSFGVRRVFNGKIASRHRGIDLGGPRGTPVVAANDGVVTLVSDNFFYVGNMVLIDHGHALFTVYLHLDEAQVKSGQAVQRGDVLGTIGSTGRVTGPHLHFGVKLNGIYVNPFDLLELPAAAPLPSSLTAGPGNDGDV